MTLLSIQNLTLTIRGTPILHDVSFGIAAGETVELQVVNVGEVAVGHEHDPWQSPADHPSNAGSRPIDVDDMRELEGGGYYDYDGKLRHAPPPYWTLKTKLLLAAGTVLLAGVAAGAAVGIVLAGGNTLPVWSSNQSLPFSFEFEGDNLRVRWFGKKGRKMMMDR